MKNRLFITSPAALVVAGTLAVAACGGEASGPSGTDGASGGTNAATDAALVSPTDAAPALVCPTTAQRDMFTAHLSGKTMACSLGGGPEWPCQFEAATVITDETNRSWCVFRCKREQGQDPAPGMCDATTVAPAVTGGGITCHTPYDTPMACH